METEVPNCRRFAHAWRRFRDENMNNIVGDQLYVVLHQYRQMAETIHQSIGNFQENGDVIVTLKKETMSIISEIEKLVAEHASTINQTEPFRIPRPMEIIKEKEARKHLQAKHPITQDRSYPQQNYLEDNLPQEEVEKEAPLRADQENPAEFQADDFKTMLDLSSEPQEKLSTRAIRKRLGLVDRGSRGRDEQMSASDAVAREEQESIQSDMVNLAKQLKERTQTINQSLVEDVKILDAVGQSAEANTTLLERENAVLKKQLASSIGFWTSLWLIAVVVVVFVIMYLYMKLFSRRRW